MTQILSHEPKGRQLNYGHAALYAAKQRKISTWRIALEMFLLSRGPGRLTADDYFLHGVWQPGISRAERRAFVGSKVNRALNRALNPPLELGKHLILQDKLASQALFTKAGLPQPRCLAVASLTAPGEGLRWLDSPAATLAFLGEAEALPCFCKPVFGSLGAGAASLVRLDGESLILGDGRKVAKEALVAEIWRDHAQGFIFQELIHPHPDLATWTGPVIGSLRVVTIDAGGGPEVLYARLKAPAAGAMVDSASGPLGCYAAVDHASGRVLRLQDRRQMGGVDLAANPVTGLAAVGEILPDFAEAKRLAVQAHRALGDFGLLGMDILLSEWGPLVVEANGNPHHTSYQTASSKGVLSPELLPRLEAVRARFRAVTPRPELCPLK